MIGMNNKMKIEPSTRKDKKLMAVFDDGEVVHFGAKGYSDYTIHKDPKRKERYLARHRVNENWSDLRSPGALSRYILWEKPDIDSAIRNYKKMIRLSK